MIELFCSCEVFQDAHPAYVPIRKWIKAALDQQLASLDTQSRPVLICLIPSIMPQNLAAHYKEILRHRKKGNEIEFRPAFDYNEFMSLSEVDRRKLVVSSLLKIVPLIEKLDLEPETKAELRQIFENFVAEHAAV